MPPKKTKGGGYPVEAPAPPAAGRGTPTNKKGGSDSKGSGGSKKDEIPTNKKPENKATKKQDRAANEAARRNEVDLMLNPPSGDEDGYSSGPAGNAQGDGTTAQAKAAAHRAEQKQQKEEEDQEREAARQRRNARLEAQAKERAEKESEQAQKAANRVDPGAGEEEAGEAGTTSSAIAAVLKKVAAGGKLSNKEQRLYDRHQQKQKDEDEDRNRAEALQVRGPSVAKWIEELRDFSLSVPDSAITEGAQDVHLDRVSISVGGNRLFDDASLTLACGRRYGLLGPNGQGKTTLLKFLASRRLPTPSHWTITLVEQEAEASSSSVVDTVLAGDVSRSQLLAEEASLLEKLEQEGDKLDGAECAALCERLTTVGEELDACGAEAAEAKVRQILCGLGFTETMMEGPVEVLSGGWRMRVSLAHALYVEPSLLLLDEPTNHLDLDAVIWLDNYLSEYKKTILVVSHDADFLDSVCTDIVHLEEHKLYQYKGGYNQFTKAHAQHMKEREAAYKKQQEDKAKAAAKKKAGKMVVEPLTKPKDYVVKFAFFPPADDDEMAGISVHDACFSYNDKKPWLLQNLNFRVDAASRIAVVGPNGAGKSTLLSLVAKVCEPCVGEVNHSRRLVLGRYSQHFDEISAYLHMTAVEFLTSPELRRFGAGTANPELAHKCLGQFGLPSHGHTRPMRELSGGQKARVCFASITCRRPQVLILDEPTNHLDIESVEALIEAVKRYKGGLLLVSHDVRLIQAADCELWVCRGDGQSIEKASSFADYKRQVLKEIAKRERAAELLAKKRAEARRKRREEMSQRTQRKAH